MIIFRNVIVQQYIFCILCHLINCEVLTLCIGKDSNKKYSRYKKLVKFQFLLGFQISVSHFLYVNTAMLQKIKTKVLM